MFWVALKKGERSIIETDDGNPPEDRDLIILGGFIRHEEAQQKMNEGRQQRPALRS